MNIEENGLNQVGGTHKQIIGNEIILKPAPEKGLEWRGILRGTFFNTDRNSDKTSLRNIKTNATKVSLVDGEHDGEYYILRLNWEDNSEHTANEWRFNMEILQDR